MAIEPDDFSDGIEHWPRLTPAQRAALARQLVARSRGGEPVTEEMVALLALLRQTGTGKPSAFRIDPHHLIPGPRT